MGASVPAAPWTALLAASHSGASRVPPHPLLAGPNSHWEANGMRKQGT